MTASPRLSDQTLTAIRKAEALVARDRALHQLVAMLDEAGTMSTWARAGSVSGRLRRFQAAAWQRIAAGHREPVGPLEAALRDCVRGDCPTSQRRLTDLLATLGL